jgi:branched-chain amino acid transport system permease protein
VFVVMHSMFASFGPWYLLFLGLLAILIMLFAPKGIWGAIQDKYGISIFPTRRRLNTK